MSKLSFPEGFVWGAATSSYQIEGATRADGRGEANWDVFSHISGNILNGDTGDVACDHYNRWREDIGLMRSIGLNSYRFSIAWSRIFPDGDGKVNQKRARLLLTPHRRPVGRPVSPPLITLYHWDYPWVLENEGAWRERPIVDKFAHYTDVVSRAYGDRTQRWATHNEPAVAAYLGHWNGVHSPGKKDFGAALRARPSPPPLARRGHTDYPCPTYPTLRSESSSTSTTPSRSAIATRTTRVTASLMATVTGCSSTPFSGADIRPT